jgi:serine/threonine-protein kinase
MALVAEASQYRPGQQLPGTVYRVVKHLATGGMGSVYDVEDVTVGKRYVLKTLHPQLVSREDLAKRMEAEARTLAKLQHPNIVDVVTAGLTTDAQPMPFYVMERLNGQNLRVVIEKKGSLELTHCYRIAIDVLDALEQAHENAVIHRDVKPENIFLHRNANGTTTTKLLDFGIMRLLDRKVSHTHGKFIGTLRYASPEQIFGGELGPATDIYSLGIVLYEMIAGRGPFDDVGDAYAIGAAHAQRPPPPPSQFAAVPPALERLVMTALAKQPQDRPRDCFTFASELRRLLRSEEAEPRLATAVNVLSSAPPRTVGELPVAATEAASSRSSGSNGRSPSSAPTDIGMMPPSVVHGIGSDPALPPTRRHGPPGVGIGGVVVAAGAGVVAAGRGVVAAGAGVVAGTGTGAAPGIVAAGTGTGAVVGPVAGSTEFAAAATLASEPGASPERVAAAMAVAAADARANAKPPVDRFAETRASEGTGLTQRIAPNGTAMDLGMPPPAMPMPEEAIRAALARREPLEVPPASGTPYDPRHQGIVFPHAHGFATGTGPLAAEARTRPPERGILLPVIAAAAIGALLVGSVALALTKPWAKHPSSAASAPPAVSAPALSTSAAPVVTATATAAPSTAPTVTSATPIVSPVTLKPAVPAPAVPTPAAAPAAPSPPAKAAAAPPHPAAPLAAPTAAPAPKRTAHPTGSAPAPADIGF